MKARLSLLGGAVALLHLAGWGLFAYYSRSYPALAGLGTLAYTFGLRHAFDADHIAAIDNTTRKLLQDGQKPVGVGFFFSLGHSSVVLALTAALATAATAVKARIPSFQHWGGYVGAGVSGTFLLAIGVLNLVVLLDVIRIFRELRSGTLDEERLERRLLERGLMSRLFVGRFVGRIRASWQLYPLGVLFGLGFDTATEVGLLALSAGVATNHAPPLAVLSLPILFAAAMSLMDTIDGAFMAHAYGWAFSHPVRKVYYNLTVTSLSVAVALGIGMIELLQVLARWVPLDWAPLDWVGLDSLDFGTLGYGMAALFVATWLVSAVVWKAGRVEERWSSSARRRAHAVSPVPARGRAA